MVAWGGKKYTTFTVTKPLCIGLENEIKPIPRKTLKLFKFFTNPIKVSKFFLGNKKKKSLAAQIFFVSFSSLVFPTRNDLPLSVPVAQSWAKPQVNC